MHTTETEIVALAQELLSHRYGGKQHLSEVHRLSGSGPAVVLRARLANQPFLQQRSVVIKYVPGTGDGLDDAALLREVAAYQFTTSLSEEVRPGPMLIAHDVAKRVLVLSDSGEGTTLAQILEQRDPETRGRILRKLGLALGRMHAGTAGKGDGFDVLLGRLLKAHPGLQEGGDMREHSIGPTIVIGLSLVESAGFDIPEEVRHLATEAGHQLASERTSAFSPFDLSPDNIIVAEQVQFLDYEWAGFRDVFYDLACVIGGFPQFVGTRRIEDEETETFLRAWVDTVAQVWPSVTDTHHLQHRIAAALTGWALSSVAMLHHGSLTSALTADDAASPDLLRPAHEGPFDAEEQLIRQDFHETFDALARFTAGTGDPTHAAVAAFAAAVAERVDARER